MPFPLLRPLTHTPSSTHPSVPISDSAPPLSNPAIRSAQSSALYEMSSAPRRHRTTTTSTTALSTLPNAPPTPSFASPQHPAHPSPKNKFFRSLPFPFSAKSRPTLRRSLILFTAAVFVTLLFVARLTTPPLLNEPADDILRYSHAAAHFRKHMRPDQLEAYYKAREAALRSAAATVITDAHDAVTIPKVHSPFFRACVISPDTTVMHPALRMGPDSQEIAGRVSAKQPRDFDDTFATIDRRRFFFHPDRPAVRTVDALGAGLDTDLDDAIRVARAVVERDLDARVANVVIPIAYMRNTRRHGIQTIVNIGGNYNRTSGELRIPTAFRRLVTVTRGFGRPCEVNFVRPREMVRIHVIVPYSHRPHRLEAFLKMFAMYFSASHSKLLRIVISTTEEEESDVLAAGDRHSQLDDERFSVVTSKGDESGQFSRAVALREAVKTVPKDEVVFFADADLAVGGNFLQNCRVNVVKGYQVWFPVMFSLYPYGKRLSSKDGLWRRSSYGMACMYRTDFDAVGGFGGEEETAFTGWGSEDVFLYNRFRDHEKYAVLRTLEPGLQHQWHGKDCERNEHYESCMRTVYMTIGSQDQIAKLMADANVDISNLTKKALPV